MTNQTFQLKKQSTSVSYQLSQPGCHRLFLTYLIFHVGDEGDEKEYAGTPELFSTPPEDQEQLFGVLKVFTEHVHLFKCMIVWVRVCIILKSTVVGGNDWHFGNLNGSHLQSDMNCFSTVDNY